MAKEPIVTDLFRFVTVRSPQLLDEEQKERGFSYFPMEDVELSHFLRDFGGVEDNKAARKAYLKQQAASFENPFTSLKTIRELDPRLYDFSLWLMKNKNI